MNNSKLAFPNRPSKTILYLVTALLFELFVFSSPTSVFAQTASLSITPPVIEILLSPNKNIIQAFTIKNQGESGKFVANLHAITPIDSAGHVSINPTPLTSNSIPLIFNLQNADLALNSPFFLQSGKSQQLVLSLTGTATNTPHDIYFALVVSPVSSRNSQLSSTIPGISSLILVTLTANDNLPVKLELADFDPPTIHDNLTSLVFSPVLKNLTPNMLRTEGKLEAISPTGKTVSSLPLYPNLVLGNSSRILQGLSGDPQSPATVRAEELAWSPTLLNLGPYRLRLTVTTLGGTKIQELERTVWLLPLRLLTSLIILILVLLGFLLSRRRRQPPTT